MGNYEFIELADQTKIRNNYWKSIFSDIKYLIEKHFSLIKFIEIYFEHKLVGFCIYSFIDSFFYPGNSILQFSLNKEVENDSLRIIMDICSKFDIKKVIVSTEDPEMFALFLDTKKQYEVAAYGFDHGEDEENVKIRHDCIIQKAQKNEWNHIKEVWLSIYKKFNVDPKECLFEMERTLHQIENGDVYIIKINEDIIGFGNANFKYNTNGKVEIGFAIKPEYSNQGYATTVASYLKNECKINGYKSIAHCNYPHPASEKVLKKIGMRPYYRVVEFAL